MLISVIISLLISRIRWALFCILWWSSRIFSVLFAGFFAHAARLTQSNANVKSSARDRGCCDLFSNRGSKNNCDLLLWNLNILGQSVNTIWSSRQWHLWRQKWRQWRSICTIRYICISTNESPFFYANGRNSKSDWHFYRIWANCPKRDIVLLLPRLPPCYQ